MATAFLLILVVVAQLINHVQPKQPPAVSPSAAQPSSSELALRDQVRNLQQKQNELTAQIQKEEAWLRKANTDKEALGAQITALQKENDEGRNRELQAEGDVQRLARQLEDAQMEQTAARNNNALNTAQITELTNRVSAAQLELSRQRRLSTSLQEMRDLMENRDVRVIQLGTVNQGKRVRAFGRAFYIPGQKLVLFAYDLSDPEALTAHSLYVWGDTPGTTQPAQALGKLTLEDKKDDRWAIRIESPDVFAKINEIFITMESSTGKVEKPTGQPMLLTSLTKSTP